MKFVMGGNVEILFFEREGWSDLVGHVISWATGSRFTHVAIVIDGALFEAVRSGIRALEGEALVERRALATEIVSLRFHPDRALDGFDWLYGQVGSGYSRWGVVVAGLSLLLMRLKRKRVVFYLEGEYFCSALVGTGLFRMGFRDPTRNDPYMESPGSLAMDLGVN